MDLIAAARTVSEVASGLGAQWSDNLHWRNQDLIDRGMEPDVTSTEQTELAKARRRIAELKAELAACRSRSCARRR